MLYKIKTKVLKQCMIPSIYKDGDIGYETIRLVCYMEGEQKYCVDLWITDIKEKDSAFLFYDSDEFDNDLAAEAAFDYLVRSRLFMSHCPEYDGNDVKINTEDFNGVESIHTPDEK